MLKGIPTVLNPELLKILMEMGHGDTLVIGDGNFPAATYAQRLVRCDGQTVPEMLDAILKLFPLDTPDTHPVCVMQTAEDMERPPVWSAFEDTISRYEPDGRVLTEVERYAFYEKAKNAYAIVSTGETALFANILIKKGVVLE